MPLVSRKNAKIVALYATVGESQALADAKARNATANIDPIRPFVCPGIPETLSGTCLRVIQLRIKSRNLRTYEFSAATAVSSSVTTVASTAVDGGGGGGGEGERDADRFLCLLFLLFLLFL